MNHLINVLFVNKVKDYKKMKMVLRIVLIYPSRVVKYKVKVHLIVVYYVRKIPIKNQVNV